MIMKTEANDVESSSSSGEEKKAEIYLRPEDAHPNGVNIEIGTASFWLEVGARISGDSGETVSYQWYESKDGTMENIVKVEGETKPIFIPEQKIGTTYYCVGVITTVNGKSTTEFTKLLEATFTPKMIDKIWIVGVKTPVSGETIEASAQQYTDYDLNDYFGYEITSVNWTPDDELFKVGQAYTVNISIEYWDNIEFTSELDVRVNDNEATIEELSDGKSAIISYTFEEIKEDFEEPSGEEEKDDNDFKVDNEVYESKNENAEETKVEVSTVILVTVFVIIVIFSLMLLIKRN